MNIKFNCPKCDQKLAVDQTAAGASVNCPNCSEPLVVPASSAVERAPAPAPQKISPPPPRPAPRFPPGPPPLPPERAKALAVWALVLGIIGVVPVLGLGTGIFGLALGIAALFKKATSRGLAIAGTALGGIATLMIPIHIALLTPVISAAKFGAGTTVCLTNLKAIGIGIVSYQQRHNGTYPENLEVLVKEGIIPAKTLRCPLHDGKVGGASYGYSRPAGRQARGIIAWDRFPHRAMNKIVAGRNVVDANGSARFMTEDQFRAAPRAASMPEERVTRSGPPTPGRKNDPPKVSITPQPRPVEQLTVETVLSSLKSTPPRDLRPPLKFLADASVAPESRAAVIAAVQPLLNDVEFGDQAFQVFSKWADKEQVPDLIEFVKIAPSSSRGKQAMKLLSRMGDARAAGPLAACLAEFRAARDAKAALAALGAIAKPAVLPLYHHEDRGARDAARELLRGYNAAEEETFAESIKALGAGSQESRRSALSDLSTAKLTPDKQAAAARAMRPLVTDGEDRVRDAARNAMKTLATPADADFLLAQLSSTDDATRQFATDLLVRFKDARAAKPIAVLLSDSHKTYPAGKALISLGSAAEPAVIPYLRHDDPNTRKRAAEVLAEIGTSASLSALHSTAKDGNFFAKVAAERAINAIKSRPAGTSGPR